jgi:TIR domain
MGKIFISYRREDTQGEAGHLLADLRRRFGQDRVFLDVAAIRPGEDFRKAVEKAVGSCMVLLVLIGKKWSTVTDPSGRRRLDDPRDFVRFETAVALRRDVRVIPVLVQGAAMPKEEELPDELKALVWRNALELSHSRWDYDTEQLIGAIDLAAQADNITERRDTGPTSASGPAANESAEDAAQPPNALGSAAGLGHIRGMRRSKKTIGVAAGAGLLALGLFGWSAITDHFGTDHHVSAAPRDFKAMTTAQPESPAKVVSPRDQVATENSTSPNLPPLIERDAPQRKAPINAAYEAGVERMVSASPKFELSGILAGSDQVDQEIRRRCQRKAAEGGRVKCELDELNKHQKELSERLQDMDQRAKDAIKHIRAG